MEQTQKLDNKQAAKYLGLAPQTLANFRFQGKGPAYCKLGRRVLYQLKDLNEYVEGNRIEPEAA